MNKAIFKAYDIRGIYPQDLDESAAEIIAQSYLKFLSTKLNKPIKDLVIAVGKDVRQSSEPLLAAVVKIFLQYGAHVDDLGLLSINDYYFAVGKYQYDGGLMGTASHNPSEYGGFKMTIKNLGKPDSILFISGIELYDFMSKLQLPISDPQIPGKLNKKDVSQDHLKHVLSFVDISKIKPLKVVVDTGNGMNGILIPQIFKNLPCELIHMFPDLDGSFPNRAPNPLTKGAPDQIRARILEAGADLGFICDVDGDRINLVDEKGNFYKGDMSMLPMVKSMLAKHPGAGIVYNLICSHSVRDLIVSWGGKAIRSEVGYLNLARHMMTEGGVMSGEVSAHYAFRDNFYADSAFIAMLLTLKAVSQDGRAVSQIMSEYNLYHKSEELNFVVKDIATELLKFRAKYQANILDEIDGLTVEYTDYWFNVRGSNTEPLLRLTVEANTQELLSQKIAELESLIDFSERK